MKELGFFLYTPCIWLGRRCNVILTQFTSGIVFFPWNPVRARAHTHAHTHTYAHTHTHTHTHTYIYIYIYILSCCLYSVIYKLQKKENSITLYTSWFPNCIQHMEDHSEKTCSHRQLFHFSWISLVKFLVKHSYDKIISNSFLSNKTFQCISIIKYLLMHSYNKTLSKAFL